jgi:prepilin-type N-terminal cleavage/methylation domain-containing protein
MKKQLGFTLLEMLVVITLTVILSVSAASLFFTTLVGNTKKESLSTVKQEGDYTISQLEFLLRNAVSLVPPVAASCTNNMSSITFKLNDGGITTLSKINGKIASQSASSATPVYLTSDSVVLASGPRFDCTQASVNKGTYIKISFTLSKLSPDFNTPTDVTETFTTSVNVRSF